MHPYVENGETIFLFQHWTSRRESYVQHLHFYVLTVPCFVITSSWFRKKPGSPRGAVLNRGRLPGYLSIRGIFEIDTYWTLQCETVSKDEEPVWTLRLPQPKKGKPLRVIRRGISSHEIRTAQEWDFKYLLYKHGEDALLWREKIKNDNKFWVATCCEEGPHLED